MVWACCSWVCLQSNQPGFCRLHHEAGLIYVGLRSPNVKCHHASVLASILYD